MHSRTIIRNGRESAWLASSHVYHYSRDVHTSVYRSLPRTGHPTRYPALPAAYLLLCVVLLLLSVGLFVDALVLFRLL